MAYRRSKFGAIRTEVDGITFASKSEASRYAVLKILEAAGQISDLELQPRFRCEVNGVKICDYVADFAYTKDGKYVVEDVKGIQTPVYRLKKKLMQALHNINIVEITK